MWQVSIKTITLEDSDSVLFNAKQELLLREKELITAKKAVEEADSRLRFIAAECLKKQSLKLSLGEIVYAPNYNLTFIAGDNDNIYCIGVDDSEDYEKLN